METHTVKPLNIFNHFKMCCVGVIIPRESYPFLHTKSNMNNMSTIDIYLLKKLDWITLVQPYRQERYQHLNHSHAMLCFTIFFLITTDKTIPQNQYTENTSLNFKAKKSVLKVEYTMVKYI